MSFFRVSTNYSSNNLGYHNQKRGVDIARSFGEQANQRRVQDLRDDPLAASHSVRYQSMIHRNENYQKNLEMGIQASNYIDSTMQGALELVQRARELTIRGASSTLNREQREAIAIEIDEILVATLDIANSKDGDGNYLFSGTKTANEPFRLIYSRSSDGERDMISRVEYLGNDDVRMMEIDESRYIETNYPGSEVFWAENQKIVSATSALGYSTTMPSTINIDGHDINFEEGENIYSIMDKINNSSASVKTYLDPLTNTLIMESTTAHKLFIKDVNGSVMQDLGVIIPGREPYNINPTAFETGGSVFDMMISVRDALLDDNVIDIGGSALHGIDNALDNLLYRVSEIGSKAERMEFTVSRLSKEGQDLNAQNSQAIDLDVVDAVNRFKQLQIANNAALTVTSKVYDSTLLNFIR